MPTERLFQPKVEISPQSPLGLEEVLVAGNRGTCGGVRMAIEAAQQVVDIVAKREPIYINWNIVNNRLTAQHFQEQGVIDVANDLSLVPDDSILLFSAHGVAPSFYEEAERRNLLAIDATCQLVERGHWLARRAAERGEHVFYIGDAAHPETQGIVGELKEGEYTLLEKPEDVDAVSIPEGPSIVLSKTTLGAAEIVPIIKPLHDRVGDNLKVPTKHDTCFATDNRQDAVRDLIGRTNALLVVGSGHSHNSQQLRLIGEKSGLPSWSVDTPEEIERSWFTDEIKKLGITSGASVVGLYTERVLDYFRNEGIPITYVDPVAEEPEIMFKLPIGDINKLRMRYNMDPIQ